MRNWLFHPLIFYPMAAVFAAFVIAFSLKPQAWPREPAPAVSASAEGAIVFSGAAFDAPEPHPDQNITVTRDFWGNARTLRIAVHQGLRSPGPDNRGVRLLLTPADAAALAGRRLTVEISYNALPVNAAQALAVSAQDDGPVAWITQAIPPQNGTVRLEVNAPAQVRAIGLRALSEGGDAAFGLEITRIRIIPHA